jgi:hypothetical protein
MYSVNFKKKAGKLFSSNWVGKSRAILPFGIQWFACFKIDKAQRHPYSMFDVGRSMFNVHLLNHARMAYLHRVNLDQIT